MSVFSKVCRHCSSSFYSLKSELAYVKSNSDYIVGFTAWAAGAFDTTYALTITPNSDGSDQAIWTDASEYFAA